MPQAANRTTMTIALERKLKEKVFQAAKKRGVSAGQLVCQFINDGIEEHRQFHAMMAHPEIRKNLIGLFSNPESMHAVADVMKSAMTPEKTQQKLLDFMENFNDPSH